MAQYDELVDIVSNEQVTRPYAIPAPFLPCGCGRRLRPTGS